MFISVAVNVLDEVKQFGINFINIELFIEDILWSFLFLILVNKDFEIAYSSNAHTYIYQNKLSTSDVQRKHRQKSWLG